LRQESGWLKAGSKTIGFRKQDEFGNRKQDVFETRVRMVWGQDGFGNRMFLRQESGQFETRVMIIKKKIKKCNDIILKN